MLGPFFVILPVFAGCVWLAMLLGMLLTWVTNGFPRYASMEPGQHIVYISDVGATNLKPLFIAMSTVTVVTFDFVFIFERVLRHTGRLTPNTSWWQKTWSLIAIIGSIAGAAGLILLSIFDTLRHPRLHDDFLILFIVGYVVCAIFVCAEYQRLGIHYRQHPVLRYSFWVKLAFIIIEVALAIAFGVMNLQSHWNRAAILEWIIALVYFFYVISFAMDFLPAVGGKNKRQTGETEIGMAEREGGYTNGDYANGNSAPYNNGTTYGNGAAYMNGNGYGRDQYTNGYREGVDGANGRYYPDGHKPQEPVPASRNF